MNKKYHQKIVKNKKKVYNLLKRNYTHFCKECNFESAVKISCQSAAICSSYEFSRLEKCSRKTSVKFSAKKKKDYC